MSAAIVRETLALLRVDFANADVSPYPKALREAAVEIALSRLVGAVAGYEAERQLAKLLGWERVYEIGSPHHCAAGAPAAPPPPPAASVNPALVKVLQGLLEARDAARAVAAAGPYRGAWTAAQGAELDRLAELVLIEGPQRWQAAQQLVDRAKAGS